MVRTGFGWIASTALLFGLVPGPLAALDPARQPSQCVHRSWSAENGLPHSTVQAIAQTPDGYLWLGTQDGLARFDGVRFVVFETGSSPELGSNWISCLLVDRTGRLWIGGRAGLVRYSGGRFRRYTLADGLSSERIRALYEDRQGALWIGTSGGGLNRFEDGHFTSIRSAPDGLPSDQIVSIFEDRAGALWIGTYGGGLVRIADGRFTVFQERDGLANDQVSSIVEDRHGALWVGTFGGGVSRFENGRFTRIGIEQGLGSNEVWSVLEDGDGNIWIGSAGGGLARWRNGRLSRFTTAEGLSNDVVVSLFEDRDRNLWVGTFGGGVNLLRDGALTPFTTREGLSHDVALAVFADSAGTIWVGTDGGGLNHLRAGQVTTFTSSDGLGSNHVATTGEGRPGEIWAGSLSGGVYRLQGDHFATVGGGSEISGEVVSAIYRSPSGDVWLGTDDGSVYCDRAAAGSPLDRPELRQAGRVTSFLMGRNGDFWIGTAVGLTRSRAGFLALFTTKNGLTSDRINALLEDADGQLWIATSGGGLNRFAAERFTSVTAREGLTDDTVFSILEDARGRLWMSGNRGIFQAPRVALAATADRRTPRVACTTYGTADGMRSIECNGQTSPAATRSGDGKLWYPTMKGIVAVDPERIGSKIDPPAVAIEEVVGDGRSFAWNENRSVQIPPGTKTLDLRYTAFRIGDAERIRFRYRLEGFDPSWVDAGSERIAHYTALPPGDYRFTVTAGDEGSAALAIRLEPYFYQTRIFQLFVILALLAAGFLGHRLRVRALRRRQLELERVVGEQTRDLRAANADLEAARDRLSRLTEPNPDQVENLSTWTAKMAAEIQAAIHARRVEIWRAEGQGLIALSPSPSRRPEWRELLAARQGEFRSSNGVTILPVVGLTGEIRGALVIEGPVEWPVAERQLVVAFARHLGGALDIQALRRELSQATARQAELRRRMSDEGIPLLQLCPRCRSAYDETLLRCPLDDAPLDGSRLLPLCIAGRYRLTKLLGEGGMGSVFAAIDERLHRAVALKVIRGDRLTDPETRFRFEREAKLLAQVHHPSVIALFDSGELDDGSAYLVMELLRGRDLATVLLDHGPGTPAEVARVVEQIGAALAATHRVGVVHRDVKPANIVLVPAGEALDAKILDFGLARSTQPDAVLTQSGIVIGTPSYMSPEQVRGDEVDVRTDVYLLAAVAYEALTGRRLVPGSDLGRVLVDVLYSTPPAPSSLAKVTPEVDRLFAAAFGKRPSDRPPSIAVWSAELAASLANCGDSSPPAWPPARIALGTGAPGVVRASTG